MGGWREGGKELVGGYFRGRCFSCLLLNVVSDIGVC